jgi:hypothetical protein
VPAGQQLDANLQFKEFAMRKGFQLSAFVVVVLAASSCPAQDVCVELAKTMVFNTNRTFTQDEQSQISRADLCIENYSKNASSRAAQIELAYKFFSGAASGSEDQIRTEQAKRCENKMGDFWSKSISSTDARTASADSVAVIGECLRLTAGGLRPRATIQQNEFSLLLEWSVSPAADLMVNHVGPVSNKGTECHIQTSAGMKPILKPADATARIPSGGSLTLLCARPAKAAGKVADGVKCYPPVLLSIATNGPSAVIKVPEACFPSVAPARADQLERRLTAAESLLTSVIQPKLAALENQGAALNQVLSAERNAVRYAVVKEGDQCAAGWTDLGRIGWLIEQTSLVNRLSDGGQYTPGWSWQHPHLCRRL